MLIEPKQYLFITRLLICMSKLTCWDFAFLVNFCCVTLTTTTTSLSHIPSKCQGQNNRMKHPIILCVCENLDFSIGFATNISNFTPPSPFCVFFI